MRLPPPPKWAQWTKTLNALVKTSFTGRYALLTNTVTGSLLFVIGDVVEQKIEVKRGLHDKIDGGRVARIAAVGLFEAPPHFYFYKYLDQHLPGRTFQTISKKILLDQLIACPLFSLQFFMGMSLLEGKTLKQSWNEFKTKFPTVYLMDWLLWPPFQIINFYFVKPRYRVLYVNSVTVLWNVFLSYMKHYDQFKEV